MMITLPRSSDPVAFMAMGKDKYQNVRIGMTGRLDRYAGCHTGRQT